VLWASPLALLQNWLAKAKLQPLQGEASVPQDCPTVLLTQLPILRSYTQLAEETPVSPKTETETPSRVFCSCILSTCLMGAGVFSKSRSTDSKR
jgi:hypothetical protein